MGIRVSLFQGTEPGVIGDREVHTNALFQAEARLIATVRNSSSEVADRRSGTRRNYCRVELGSKSR